MTLRIDLNADLGEATTPEGRAAEAALFPIVTSVNIACGGHAGDEASMRAAVTLAKRHGLAVGAHPSYPDRDGFGRLRMAMEPEALEAALREQITSLAAIAAESGVRLGHVKPHGALYHAAADDEATAGAVLAATRAVDPGLRLVAAAGSQAIGWWRAGGSSVIAEAFADRLYGPDGRLRPRSDPGAVIQSPDHAASQALEIVRRGIVAATNGAEVVIAAQTICLHGDTPDAAAIAARVRAALETAGVRVGAISDV